MNQWKVILATLAIFCSGLVTGVVLVKNVTRHQPGQPVSKAPAAPAPSAQPLAQWHFQQRELLRRLDQELKLSDTQEAEVDKILKESAERSKQIREKIAPEMRDEMKKVREQMRAVLTPDQQGKFEAAMAKPLRKDGKDNKGEEPKEPKKRNREGKGDTNRVPAQTNPAPEAPKL